MKAPRFFSLAVALLLLALVFTGCSESPFESDESLTVQEPLTKLRHPQLLDAKFLSRAKKPDNGGDTSEPTATASNDFVLAVSSVVLEPMRVLERYDALAGANVTKSFKKSFTGFALHIETAQLEALLAMIEADPEIDWYEPDPKVSQDPSGSTEPMEDGQSRGSSLSWVQAQNTWTLPGDGSGSVDIDIYIIDTGVDHPDVNVVERIDFDKWGKELDMTKVLERYRVLERYEETLESAKDKIGHGTHIAGVAAAIDDSQYMVGVAPGARVHDFNVFDKDGQAAMSSVTQALDLIQSRKELNPSKPIVVNLSLGADIGSTDYNALDLAVQGCIDAGVVVVVAAGNDGIDAATVTPAHVAGAITVASAKAARKDRDGWLISSFSNFGSVIDIFAPGEEVVSLSPDATVKVTMAGTSMAAPHVTGGAALYLAKNPSATPQEVRDVLVSMANPEVNDRPANTTNGRLWLADFCTDACTPSK